MKRSDLPAVSLTPARRALLEHYDEHRRTLPWRGEDDPYRVLVSEVMLQQTRVETVMEYYGPWLERFPDLESLAAAELDDVLEAWEGLGYYRRARNLHRAARVVRERPDASLPGTYAELRELPGVGPYTAGAVASIAFGEAVPAPDGNVRRVLSRLFDAADPKPAWLRDTAAALLDPDRPGDWNQALMELGATICVPRAPACGRCPVAEWCAARAAGTQEERPGAVARRAPRRIVFAVAVVHHAGSVLLLRRPADGLLGGMWTFAEAEVEVAEAGGGAGAAAESGADVAAVAAATAVAAVSAVAALPAVAAVSAIAKALGARTVGDPEPLPVREHRFTHLHATYVPYLVDVVEPPNAGTDATWVDLADPAGVALPVAQRRILESARDHLGSGVT